MASGRKRSAPARRSIPVEHRASTLCDGGSIARALRSDRHRKRPRRRFARPSARPDRKAHPHPRTRRLSAARGGELERAGRLRRWQVPSRRDMDQRRWGHLQSATPLFRRRQFQGVWRSPLPAARARFRRDHPCRRHLAGLAAQVSRLRPLLRRRRGAVPRARRARRRPDRASGSQALSVSCR